MDEYINALWAWVSWGIGAVWPVIVAIPGIVAFLWTRKDRQDRNKLESPFAEVRINESPREDGWHECLVLVHNRWDEPFTVSKIDAPKGIKVSNFQRSDDGEKSAASRRLRSNLIVRPHTQSTDAVWSGSFGLLVRPASSHSGINSGSDALFQQLDRTSLRMTIMSHSRLLREVPISHIKTNMERDRLLKRVRSNRCSGPTFCLILHSVIESQRMERTEFLHGASNGVSLNGSE